MYTENIIERLNKIDWCNIGRFPCENDMELGCEFIKRMAAFASKHRIKRTLPIRMNISSYLNDGEIEISEEILNKCSKELREVVESPSMSNATVRFYLELAILADLEQKYAEYLEVYEPLMILFENGGYFYYRERGMSFVNSGLVPLNHWYDRFKEI